MEDELEKIVAQHTGLVKSVALRLSSVYGEEVEDLVQIGYIGLMKAARGFDVGRGIAFSTYAVPWIAGEIKSQMRDQGHIKVSRQLKSDGIMVKKIENQWMLENGISPRLSDLSKATGFSEERITQALGAVDALNHTESYERLNLAENNEEKYISKMDILTAIQKLPPKQQKVVFLRYYRDYTQQQVAETLKLSQVQVSRTERKSLDELKKIIDIFQ